jgi:hypothetical protein
MPDDPRPKTGIAGYIAAGVLGVLGCGGGMTLFAVGLTSMFNLPDPVTMPGRHEIKLEKAGNYKIYQEVTFIPGGTFPLPAKKPSFSVTVTDKDGNADIPVQPAKIPETYNFGDRNGRAVFEFDVDKPGTYVVEAQYPNNAASPKFGIVVGNLGIFRMMIFFFSGGGLAFVCLLVGGIIALVTFLRRSKQASSQVQTQEY